MKIVARQIFLKSFTLLLITSSTISYLGSYISYHKKIPPFNESFLAFLGSFLFASILAIVYNICIFYTILKLKPETNEDVLNDEDTLFVFLPWMLPFVAVILQRVYGIGWLSSEMLYILSSVYMGIPIPSSILRFLLRFNIIKRKKRLSTSIRFFTTYLTTGLLMLIVSLIVAIFFHVLVVFMFLSLWNLDIFSLSLSFFSPLYLISFLIPFGILPIFAMRYGIFGIDISFISSEEDFYLLANVLKNYTGKYKQASRLPSLSYHELYKLNLRHGSFCIFGNYMTCLELVSNWFDKCKNKDTAEATIFLLSDPICLDEERVKFEAKTDNLIKEITMCKTVTKAQIIKMSFSGLMKEAK